MCGGAITTRGGGGASSDVSRIGCHQYIQFQAEVVAHTPIGVMTRVALARAVANTLPLPTPDEQAAAVALLYIVNAGTPGALRERVRTYIRWSLSFDASSTGVSDVAAVERGQLRAAFERLRGQMQAHYALKPIRCAELTAIWQGAFERAAQVAYTRLPHAPAGLTPVHVQPTLDLLVSRPSCAALQFTLERFPGDAHTAGMAPGARRLRMGIVALGAATAPGALRLLAQELRGRGALATRAPSSAASSAASPPKLNVFRPQSADDWAHICHNLCAPAAEPWSQAAQSVAMAVTSADAALLLPLPFALFD
jgi:hypothetical protein